MFLKCCHLMIDCKGLDLLFYSIVYEIWCLEFVTSSVMEMLVM